MKHMGPWCKPSELIHCHGDFVTNKYLVLDILVPLKQFIFVAAYIEQRVTLCISFVKIHSSVLSS